MKQQQWIYWLLGCVYISLFIGFVFFKQDYKAQALNTLLQQDKTLSRYPYTFRVLKVEASVAVMASPSSSQVSVSYALPLIYPHLSYLSADDPEIIKAQQSLADHQAIAAELVRAQSDITSIRWQIDKAWFSAHGIEVEKLCNTQALPPQQTQQTTP